MITISGKALGRKKPLFADWSLPLPPDLGDGGLTLRDLIARVVRAEVEAFNQRQQERRLFRALTERQIQEGAARGKVEMGGAEGKPQPADAEQVVAVALEAFEDGLYLVVVDGAEQRQLDAQIHVHEDSRVAFVRLTMLAGG